MSELAPKHGMHVVPSLSELQFAEEIKTPVDVLGAFVANVQAAEPNLQIARRRSPDANEQLLAGVQADPWFANAQIIPHSFGIQLIRKSTLPIADPPKTLEDLFSPEFKENYAQFQGRTNLLNSFSIGLETAPDIDAFAWRTGVIFNVDLAAKLYGHPDYKAAFGERLWSQLTKFALENPNDADAARDVWADNYKVFRASSEPHLKNMKRIITTALSRSVEKADEETGSLSMATSQTPLTPDEELAVRLLDISRKTKPTQGIHLNNYVLDCPVTNAKEMIGLESRLVSGEITTTTSGAGAPLTTGMTLVRKVMSASSDPMVNKIDQLITSRSISPNGTVNFVELVKVVNVLLNPLIAKERGIQPTELDPQNLTHLSKAIDRIMFFVLDRWNDNDDAIVAVEAAAKSARMIADLGIRKDPKVRSLTIADLAIRYPKIKDQSQLHTIYAALNGNNEIAADEVYRELRADTHAKYGLYNLQTITTK